MGTRLRMVLWLAAALGTASPAAAMDFHAVGDTLVLSGPVLGHDLAAWNDQFANGAKFQRVLLHESGGGDLFNAYLIADRIRSLGMDTAVSGKCESACGLIFLAGVRRAFSDGMPLARTMVGLHGAHHFQTGAALSELSPRMAWFIRRFTDDRYPPDLLRRTVYPRHPLDVVYAFHPLRFAAGEKKGVMECLRLQGEPPFRCTMLPGLDAMDIGVVTEPAILALDAEAKALLVRLGPAP